MKTSRQCDRKQSGELRNSTVILQRIPTEDLQLHTCKIFDPPEIYWKGYDGNILENPYSKWKDLEKNKSRWDRENKIGLGWKKMD